MYLLPSAKLQKPTKPCIRKNEKNFRGVRAPAVLRLFSASNIPPCSYLFHSTLLRQPRKKNTSPRAFHQQKGGAERGDIFPSVYSQTQKQRGQGGTTTAKRRNTRKPERKKTSPASPSAKRPASTARRHSASAPPQAPSASARKAFRCKRARCCRRTSPGNT